MGPLMNALEAWGDARLEGGAKAVGTDFQGIGLYVFLIAFMSVYYLSNAQFLLSHYDLGWHLAAGDLIRAQGKVPFQDPWAFTLGDKQWFNLSWLWDVLASLLFQYAGFPGITAFVVVSGAFITGYLAFLCRSRGASAAAVGIAVFSACLLYPSFPAAPNVYLAAAPNTATMVFSVIFYGECLRRTRCLLLPVMMVLWVNLHGGFPLGFFIIGIFGAVALLRRDWANARISALAGVGCLVAVFINPLGWHIYDGVAATLGHFVQGYITEWLSYYQNMTMPGSIPGIVSILVFVALELCYGASSPVPLEARLLSWLFLFLGLYQFRYIAFFFLFATVPLALHIDRLIPKQLSDAKIQGALLVAGLVGACALPWAYVRAEPDLGFPQLLSEQDARYLQTHFPHARLLNHWNVGGLLIFFDRGAVPLFVDGRAATAYPDDLLRDYFKLSERDVDEAAWDAVLEKYRIDTVLWVREHQQLRRFLVDKRGWKEAYDGAYQTIYVKP